MRRLAWNFAARIGNKYQIRLTRPYEVTSCIAVPSKYNVGGSGLFRFRDSNIASLLGSTVMFLKFQMDRFEQTV